MNIKRLLIANRGEIAVRITRAAAELGITSVAIHSSDDARSLHVRCADEAVALPRAGASAYLDIDAVVNAALAARCDALHPGYGFLSENPALARACEAAGIRWVGPDASLLELFGDKTQARALAQRCDVPVVQGTGGPTELDAARDFFASLPAGSAVMVKALAGGGGRGMRAVESIQDLEQAFVRCRAEAKAAFGRDEVYLERLIRRARHIEVQIIGDGSGHVVHLGERECSLQRRNQKLIEIAPSPTLSPGLRERLLAAALRLAGTVQYRGLGTFEFLVDDDESGQFAFIEANPRLQVEHTVTEMVTGIDLVATQLRIASGDTLVALGLEHGNLPQPRGYAVQLRINMETMQADGEAKPAGGTLAVFDPPSGPGVRVDTFGYTGYTTNPNYDSLLAKLIVHSASGSFATVIAKAYRALCEFRIDGVPTNKPFLQALLQDADVIANRVDTRWVETHAARWSRAMDSHPARFFDDVATRAAAAPVATVIDAPAGTVPIGSPMLGLVVEVSVAEGDTVQTGQQVAVLEAMKMQHVVSAPSAGIVRKVAAKSGDTMADQQPMLFIEPVAGTQQRQVEAVEIDPAYIRPDLAESIARHALGLDENRPAAVARRRKTGQRTARENLAQLLDDGSFIEYGSLVIAAQRSRRTLDDLIHNTPADGLITGIGSVNGEQFGPEQSRCVAMVYDYTVLAGTQGWLNHKKKDRLLRVAEQYRLPLVLFAEGGGGRPGDTDMPVVAGLDCFAFVGFAKLSGLVPLVGVVSGRCFAGNAALLGCCDVIIATRNSSIGMGGPAMIEGGGLGVVAPDDVGPVSIQDPNGVIDVLVDDEEQAVDVARKYLSYFQGRLARWSAGDPRKLRHLIPENRVRAYDVRTVIDALADDDSVLELRPRFGVGILTAFIRIEGRPMGLIANNSMHLGGAIDTPAADKAARFIQLCDAFDLPILSLCDTPGFMVGPESEKTAAVRHVSRMFVAGANASVPMFTVVLRKGYGLGAQSMAGGSFHTPMFTVGWPSSEFGGMGLEGAVRLGYRKELEAVTDLVERQKLYEKMVAAEYERGKGINMASYLEIDEVIDPAQTRRWLVRGLDSVPPAPPRTGKKHSFVDTW